MIYLLSFLVTFVYIFLKATQQLNVMHGNYCAVFPVSLGMGLCEVGIVLLVIKADSLLLGVANGVAGGLASMAAMRVYSRLKGGV